MTTTVQIEGEIDPKDPLIIMNWSKLQVWLNTQGISILQKEPEPLPQRAEWRQLEITKTQLKTYLKPMGYGVSDASIARLVKENGMTQHKRGRENWYVKSEVDALPAKR